MEQEMKDYLRKIAIQTKIENFKEFDKSKEETVQALIRNFELSEEEAHFYIDRFWDNNSFDVSEGISSSLVEKREFLIQEKNKKMQKYDLAIQVLEDAINGYSIEIISKKNGLSIEEIKEILN